jgi:hypothetical protein
MAQTQNTEHRRPSSEGTLPAARRGRQPSVARVAAVGSWWSAGSTSQALQNRAETRATRKTGSTGRRTQSCRRTGRFDVIAPGGAVSRIGEAGAAVGDLMRKLGNGWN